MKAMLSTSATAFSAALFEADAARVRHLDLGQGCWLLFGKLPAALTPSASELEELWAAKPTERDYYKMYGRPVAVPRFVRLYSQGPLTVSVNGGSFEAAQLSNEPLHFLERLLAGVPACEYNSVVANWYPDAHDYIGWHGDKERQCDSDSAPIVSVSLGASRRFQVRDEASRAYVFDELLSDGDCVVMGGPGFQTKFKHRVPKMLAAKDGHVGPRINLTVRKYNAVPPLAASTKRKR
jgi:alkylated DNA repair dioxygenase AlkB